MRYLVTMQRYGSADPAEQYIVESPMVTMASDPLYDAIPRAEHCEWTSVIEAYEGSEEPNYIVHADGTADLVR